MASRAFWSPGELELLEAHMHDRNWMMKVMPRLSGRSEAALRKQMCKIRIERGMSDPRCSHSTWMRNASHGSARLAAALGVSVSQPVCRVWCRQCDQQVTDVQAGACGSRWCKAKDSAA